MKNCDLARLYTAEGERLCGDIIPHSEYPRPTMVRDSFFCLNGKWDFGFGKNEIYDRRILVPFPPQSILSGVEKHIPQADHLFYKRSFTLPEGFVKGKVLLHIGAVDQYASVYLNGRHLGDHVGGYDSFTFDITNVLEDENELKIIAHDELDRGVLPYGKQREKRGGMWYTPISGIWQTVWIESVPSEYITDLSVEHFMEYACVSVSTSSSSEATVIFEGNEIRTENGMARLVPHEPRLWSPESPQLYDFKVRLGEDEVSSYFALRSIDIRTVNGIPRICLNGKPYFLHAVLDQGYYSDGILTPAAAECFEKDILLMKEMGFNTLRKHIKTEPEVFYYDCDRHGMIVMQDMINNSSYSFFRDTALPTVGLKKLPDRLLHRKKETREAFEQSAVHTVERLKKHPCVCYFTIFNEGWGQFEGDRMYRRIKALAPHHVIDTASGWFKTGESDVVSPHVYFKPVKIKRAEKPIVLSEFGGYSYSPKGHAFNPHGVYGYKLFEDAESLESALIGLYEREIIPAVERGLCGSVLTQLSDVEDETNGLVTYDRRLVKVSAEKMQRIARLLQEQM